jgi:hypothetical protein
MSTGTIAAGRPTLPEKLLANIVARQGSGIARNAAALVSVAAWADAPEGVAVLAEAVPRSRLGSCVGSGHLLARAAGCRAGVIAVRVDVAGIIAGEVDALPDDLDGAVAFAAILAECVACHEVAHAIMQRRDAPLADGQLGEWFERVKARPIRPHEPAVEAGHHDARWAATNAILQRRAAALRPACQRRCRELFLRDDLATYGHDLDAILDAVGSVDESRCLGELLAVEGDASRRLADIAAPDATRAAIIEQRRGTLPPAREFVSQ